MREKQLVTMKDVASLAGVSISTVSQVINQKNTVSGPVTLRVKQAIQQLNYAVGRKNESQIIGIILTSSNNPFYAEIIQHIERSCFESGYQLLLCTTEHNDETFIRHLKMLLSKSIAGLIMIGSEGHTIPWKMLPSQSQLPVVMMDWSPSLSHSTLIKDNSFLGAKIATEYLIKQGYQKIACILGPEKYVQSTLRQEGYRYAMQQAHLTIPQYYEIRGHFDFESGKSCGTTLLQLPDPPRAIFACNDAMAVGLYQAINEMGLKVGKDVAVMGYDDLEIAQYMIPPLTTIHQPKDFLGKIAVEIIIRKLQNKQIDPQLLEVIPHLIERESTPPSQDLC